MLPLLRVQAPFSLQFERRRRIQRKKNSVSGYHKTLSRARRDLSALDGRNVWRGAPRPAARARSPRRSDAVCVDPNRFRGRAASLEVMKRNNRMRGGMRGVYPLPPRVESANGNDNDDMDMLRGSISDSADLDEGIVFYHRSPYLQTPSARHARTKSTFGFGNRQQRSSSTSIRSRSSASKSVDSNDPGIDSVYPRKGKDDATEFFHNNHFRKGISLQESVESSEDDSRFEKTGCMWKQPRSMFHIKPWEMKWFTLRVNSTTLQWWEDESLTRLGGAMEISDCDILPLAGLPDKPYVFMIRDPRDRKPNMILACTSPSDLHQWEETLRDAIFFDRKRRLQPSGETGSRRVGKRDILYLRRGYSNQASPESSPPPHPGTDSLSRNNSMRYARLGLHSDERRVLDRCAHRLEALKGEGLLTNTAMDLLVHEVATRNRDAVEVCAVGTDKEILELAGRLDVLNARVTTLDGHVAGRKQDVQTLLHERSDSMGSSIIGQQGSRSFPLSPPSTPGLSQAQDEISSEVAESAGKQTWGSMLFSDCLEGSSLTQQIRRSWPRTSEGTRDLDRSDPVGHVHQRSSSVEFMALRESLYDTSARRRSTSEPRLRIAVETHSGGTPPPTKSPSRRIVTPIEGRPSTDFSQDIESDLEAIRADLEPLRTEEGKLIPVPDSAPPISSLAHKNRSALSSGESAYEHKQVQVTPPPRKYGKVQGRTGTISTREEIEVPRSPIWRRPSRTSLVARPKYSQTATGAVSEGAQPKQRDKSAAESKVTFSRVEVFFFPYTIGDSVPSDGGPSLGLGWDCVDRMQTDVEEFEQLRGGNVDDDFDEEEEWQDSWRVPREFFGEDGQVRRQEREERLLRAGHRRISIDLNAFFFSRLSAQRLRHARDKAATKVVNGEDPDTVEVWEKRLVAEEKISAWLTDRLKQRRTSRKH